MSKIEQYRILYNKGNSNFSILKLFVSVQINYVTYPKSSVSKLATVNDIRKKKAKKNQISISIKQLENQLMTGEPWRLQLGRNACV